MTKDEAVQILLGGKHYNSVEECQAELAKMADMISKMTEVVLCKDCRHRPYKKEIDGRVYIFEPENEDGTDYTCPYVCGDNYYTELPDDNSFCDKGERNEGETDDGTQA